MKSSRIAALLGGAALLAMALTAPASELQQQRGSWAERVQVIYLADTKSVVRKTVKVWDAQPEKNLDFVWEPAAGQGDGIGPDGLITGNGKLTWRVRGSASYDPRAVYSVYVGDLADSRMHGQGRIEVRSGGRYEGGFADGIAQGHGVRVDEDGNRYEGTFVAGMPNGAGRLMLKTGEIFVGNFVDGLRDGKGRTRLAGGTEYSSEWRRGVEVGGLLRPDALADASVGGLLKAQAGGGAAGKVEISTIVEDRMNQQASMQYQHLVQDDVVSIFPQDEFFNQIWNGEFPIQDSTLFYSVDFEDAPAFVEVEVKTKDGSRVELNKLELQVQNSETYRKPMLRLTRHFGCVGFRPTMTLYNDGWGEVEDATLNFTFSGEEEGSPQSKKFSLPVGEFDQGADVSFKSTLDGAGVSTDVLEKERFQCPSMNSINVCKSQVFNKARFGEIADYVYGDAFLSTTVSGTLDYTWSDDSGAKHKASEPFTNTLSLAVIETPEELAECGDGFGGSPEALRYQRVDLPLGQRDYVVDLPVRGNKKISQYEARLKLYAEKSSFHEFQPVATFADGSERRGKSVNLFYLKPRLSEFATQAEPAQCYLPPGLAGC